MGVITYNGVSSDTIGIVVENPPEYAYPERDYDITHVPGRNGDVVIDKGSYQNVDRSYDIAVGSRNKEFVELVNPVSEWLHSASGYARLEDTYEPDYYRLAIYKENISVENVLAHAGKATVTFNCKPQRFLNEGDDTITITETTTITNPTNFTAVPIITVYGSGEGVLRVGSYTVTISDINTSMTIDSEIEDVYSGTLNWNSYVVFTNNKFPRLVSGSNEISFSGGITKVEVVPKWWTL